MKWVDMLPDMSRHEKQIDGLLGTLHAGEAIQHGEYIGLSADDEKAYRMRAGLSIIGIAGDDIGSGEPLRSKTKITEAYTIWVPVTSSA